MRLDAIFVRFYKSFNVNHEREYLAESGKSTKTGKTKKTVKKQPWEIIKTEDEDLWFPFIKVPIDPQVTAIVGANESGKSHLLTAIESAITGKYIDSNHKEHKLSSRDFCRYSDRFLITANKSRIPEFVTEWSNITADECEKLKQYSELPPSKEFDRFFLLRRNVGNLTIYLSDSEDAYEVKPESIEEFQKILPTTRRLKNNIALPSSLPIQKIVEIILGQPKGSIYEYLSSKQRRKIRSLLDDFIENSSALRSLPRTVISSSNEDKVASSLIDSILRELEDPDRDLGDEKKDLQNESIQLAYDMICTIAGISHDVVIELADAMAEDDIGYTQALTDQINHQLAANLNFPKYWMQDNKFQIVVSVKDHNLEFSIVDRTGTKYSFEERSSGLKYFLSYFIQHRTYQASVNSSSILLMDEPDTYLSSQAQQDLLKIFEEVANPEDGKSGSQVVYVTHSPFLIDKNHSERIRVLKKGTGHEGTQVVKSTAQNRYEPLRSSIGAFVAETVYIGQCNLIVEGQVDQILLAGAATHLLREKVSEEIETLNLNEVTIVPAGGTGNIPYMTYLARGRGTEQAAVVVLLDSDGAAHQAKVELTQKQYGLQKKTLVKSRYVIQVGDLLAQGVNFPENLKEPQIEDLIPLRICFLAAQKYAEVICGMSKRVLKDIKEEMIEEAINSGVTMFKAVNSCIEAASKDKPQFDKLPFARSVLEIVNELRKEKSSSSKELEPKDLEALDKFNNNFKVLFRELNDRMCEADIERTREKASERVKIEEETFFNNYPNGARKESALKFLQKLHFLLASDSSSESESIRRRIEAIRKDYELNINLIERISDYENFKKEIKGLCYEKTGEEDIGEVKYVSI